MATCQIMTCLSIFLKFAKNLSGSFNASKNYGFETVGKTGFGHPPGVEKLFGDATNWETEVPAVVAGRVKTVAAEAQAVGGASISTVDRTRPIAAARYTAK